MTLREAIEAALPRVSKPSRYTGNEWNAIHKNLAELPLTFALAYPDAYDVGMSHLGSKILYHEVNKRPDAACERVFAPWTDMEQIMRREGIPLFSLESWEPVRNFDFLGFTLQYELTYSNVLNMLDLARIPLRARDRALDDPLVIAGGCCAMNAEPLAGFLDLVALGEAEELLHEILDTYKAWKLAGRPGGRLEILARLARLRGVYVPRFYEPEYHPDGTVKAIRRLRPEAYHPVERRVIEDMDALDYPTRPVVPYLDVVHDRAQVEIFRGCTRGCRFCHAGTVFRPVRERSPEKVLQLCEEILKNTGYNELGLVSLATSDYSCIGDVVKAVVDRFASQGVGVSLPSLRVDSVSVGLMEQVQRVRKAGITLAPEAGTQRLRNVINKTISDDDILGAAKRAWEAGWDHIKLYFMIGHPTETDEDLDGIANLAYRMIDLYREVNRGKKVRPPRITVSVSSFVPKAHTAFQFEPQPAREELVRKQQYLDKKLRHRCIEFKYHDAGQSYVEAIFSRGDRRLGDALEEAWRRGAKFDGWNEHFKLQTYLDALEACGLDGDWYANRRFAYDEVLPWEHLGPGVTKEYLAHDHQRAVEQAETYGDCRWDGCDQCGNCHVSGVWPTLKVWGDGARVIPLAQAMPVTQTGQVGD